MNNLIMLVDDLEMATDLMRYFLERAGYGPIETFDCPIRALHAIEQGAKPDFLITDYRMPGMTGLQLLDAAVAVNSTTKGIIITGDPVAYDSIPPRYSKIEKGHEDFFKLLLEKIKTARKDSVPSVTPFSLIQKKASIKKENIPAKKVKKNISRSTKMPLISRSFFKTTPL